MIIPCMAVGSAVAAEKPQPTLLPSPVTVEIRYDGPADRISVRARAARLPEVLREISRATAVTIDWRDDELREVHVSVDIEQASLERAIRQLLGGFNSALSYSSGDAGAGAPRGRLLKVAVLSSKSGASSTNDAAGGTSRGEPKHARSWEVARPDSGSVVRHLFENRFAAREIVDILTQRANANLRVETEQALVQILSERDFRRYGPAIDVLKDLAPEKAVTALARWLGVADRQMQVVAAAALGQIKHDGSVEALAPVLTGDDAVARQTAASSLARIGSETASAALLGAFVSGDDAMRQGVTVAIASHGVPAARQALAGLVAAGPGPRPSGAKSPDWPKSNREMRQ
jgi:hypothetical protein